MGSKGCGGGVFVKAMAVAFGVAEKQRLARLKAKRKTTKP